jgi:hypothetical protein
VTGVLASYDPAIVVAARAVGELFGSDRTLIVWPGYRTMLVVPEVSVHALPAESPVIVQASPVAVPSTITVNV